MIAKNKEVRDTKHGNGYSTGDEGGLFIVVTGHELDLSVPHISFQLNEHVRQ